MLQVARGSGGDPHGGPGTHAAPRQGRSAPAGHGALPPSPASSMAAAAAAFPLLKRQRASDGDKRAALLTPECSPLKGPESPSE